MSLPNFKFFVVSPGKVGQALGKLLIQKGHTCLGVWARREESAAQASTFLQTQAFWGQPFPDVLSQASLVLLTPPERVISSLGKAIAPLLQNEATLLHTAGSLPPVTLENTLIHSGALHPLQSIASAEAGVSKIPGSFMAISGDEVALSVARQLALELGGEPVQIKDPVLYHLGAVMASNTLYPLFSAACSLLERAGVSSELASKMLLPLVRGSVENIAKLGPSRGMTGPIARSDAETVARHLRALQDDPEMRELYVLLGRRALVLAEEAGAEARGLQSIATLFEEP
jgi:predicted short-subunit dehydrogenase-like oxidoreductase (DUF2520 family)